MSHQAASMESTVNSPSKARLRRRLGQFPIAWFLIALVFLIISFPFNEQFSKGDLIQGLLMTVMMLLALPVLSGRRSTVLWGIVLVVPALLGEWLNEWRPDLVPPPDFLVPGLLFIGFVVANLLRFVLHSPRVGSEVLCASIAGYLLLGLLWAFAYILVGRLIPDSFSFTGPAAGKPMRGFIAVYFSFVTLSSLGCSEIVAATGASRILTMMEAITGTFYMAMLVARLVAIYSSSSSTTHQPDSDLRGQS